MIRMSAMYRLLMGAGVVTVSAVFGIKRHQKHKTMAAGAVTYKPPERPSLTDTAMLMAMWMQNHPLAKDPESAARKDDKAFKKAGVVAIDDDGILFASDYSKEYSHAAMSLILKFGRRLKGGTLVVSRKPCSDCTKHMIQVGIKDVYYFPSYPEYSCDENGKGMVKEDLVKEDLEITDYIFKLSNMSTRMLIPSKPKRQSIENQTTNGKSQDTKFRKIYGDLYYKRKGKKLPGFEHIVSQQAIMRHVNKEAEPKWGLTENEKEEDFFSKLVQNYDAAIRWLEEHRFTDFAPKYKPTEEMTEEPLLLKDKSDDLCRHAATMAKILSNRTNDPKKGVGAVLMNPEGDYIGFGYNGYPRGINDSDMPGYGDKKEPSPTKVKYPYVIHAETNALNYCNKPGINHDTEKTTLITSKEPCDHCYHSIMDSGVRFVVSSDDKPAEEVESQSIGYKKYQKNTAKRLQRYVMKPMTE